jgi:hypothetical protein
VAPTQLAKPVKATLPITTAVNIAAWSPVIFHLINNNSTYVLLLQAEKYPDNSGYFGDFTVPC